ncbi:MAG: peroxiredoxin [Pseudomonadales bacterium]
MINVGDTLPITELKVMTSDGPTPYSTDFAAKKVVLFAVPGAFTPTCSAAHLPGFVVQCDAIKAKGVDEIICLSVNDVFVMHAWGLSANAEQITMLADGNAEFTKALGLEKDASAFQMGVRSKRFAMVVEDGKLTHLAIDEKGLADTSAEAILAAL